MPFGSTVQQRTPSLMAGKLRHRIQLTVPSKTQDSTGGFDLQQNVLWATVWASMDVLSGMEQYATESQVNRVTYRVTIRYVGYAPGWLANQAYLAGTLVIDNNGNLQQAQAAGISGATMPVWAGSAGAFTADGDPSLGITWKNLDKPPAVTGVTGKFQIVWNGRAYQINAVLNPDGRRKMLILMADQINDSTQQVPVVTTAIGAA